MSRFAIRLLMLAISATALVLVPTVTSAKAEASSRHFKKHKKHRSPGFIVPRPAGQAWPPSQPSPVCPGNGRSFDCRVWPPPYDEDPDRKLSGPDSG